MTRDDKVEFEQVGRFMTAHPVNLAQGREALVQLFKECSTEKQWILCINRRGDRCNAIHKDGHRFRFYGEAYGDVAHTINQHVRIARKLLA